MASPRLLERVAADADAPVVSWRQAKRDFIGTWQQGDHAVILGKTGRGKTTLATEILEARVAERNAKVAGFVVKRRDETSARLIREDGWSRIYDWPPTYAQRKRGKILLWPTYTRASTYAKDRRGVFLEAIDEVTEEGGWTLYLDEASYLVQSMRLRTSMDELFTQSRSNGVTLVAGSQRPVWVSRGEVSQHCWVFCFRIGDHDDAVRAGEVLGNRRRFSDVIENLGDHQFLVVNTTNDTAVISEVGT